MQQAAKDLPFHSELLVPFRNDPVGSNVRPHKLHPYTATARISAPPEQAWPILADVTHWPEWLPTMASVERLGTGPLAVGASYKVAQPNFRPTVWTVIELAPPRSFAWQASWPGARALATHALNPAAGGSSVVVLQVTFSGPLSMLARAIAGRLIRRYLALEVAALKRQVELLP